MKKDIAVIVLAAGKSTRMKSETPKPLHPICSRPMLSYVLDLVKALRATKVIAVLGYKHEEVRKLLPSYARVVLQKRPLGTADAVKQALPALKNFKGTVLILYADNPLLKPETLKRLVRHHRENDPDATLLTANLENPVSYGRILRDKYFSICGIVEEKDADDADKEIKEINTGIMCFNIDKLRKVIKTIKPNNRKKEYYLTDAVKLIYKDGGLIDNFKLKDINEAMGINSRVELAKADSIMRSRINEALMKEGVSVIDPATTFISFGTKIGIDSVIYPFTVIEKNVKIGKRCHIGPFIHIRELTVIGDDAVTGNFLEIIRSKIGSKTWIKHFGYIGDTGIGKSVNIGAGAVTANFDGKEKHRSLIKDNAFIGSDTVLVSPVKIGRGAVTGAGSVVVKNQSVGDNTVVVGVPAKILKFTPRQRSK